MDEENKTEEKKEASSIERLRTYKSDVAETLKKKKQSLARLVIAEQKRREEAPTQTLPVEEKKKFFTAKTFAIVFGSLFLAAASGTIALLFLLDGRDEPTETPRIQTWSPIFTEVKKFLPLEVLDENEIRNAVTTLKRATLIPLNGALHIVFTKRIQTPEGLRETLVTTKELLSSLPNNPPDRLLRTLDDFFFFGFYSFRTTEPLLILRNRFYDGAFLGMLEWEKFLATDLSPLFLTDISQGITTFEDLVVRNIDTRVLKNAAGDVVLLYSFVDRETIVITTKTDTFGEIVTRLKTPRPVTR